MQGLIPRATELAKLGGTFWVSFYPFIGLVIAAFFVLYLVSTNWPSSRQYASHAPPVLTCFAMDRENHRAASCFLQFSGSTFIHQGNSRMQVPEYLDRSLFAEEPTQQQPEAEAPVQSRASDPDAVP